MAKGPGGWDSEGRGGGHRHWGGGERENVIIIQSKGARTRGVEWFKWHTKSARLV